MSCASDFAASILGALVRLGVTDAVLTPGSRSQGLALELAELDRLGMLALQVRIDERSAAFTALGLAVETRRPAIVVVTSGTAVANLLPAVLEASHSGVPMLLLTSDRPEELRGTGGNQTTWQPGIFGRFVRLARDVGAPTGDPSEPQLAHELAREAIEAALGINTGNPGPVHLNLQFREPLSGGPREPGSVPASAPDAANPTPPETAAASAPDAAATPSLTAPAALPAPRAAAHQPLVLTRGPRTVVIAGHGAGPKAEELAHAGGWPLLAEASSGSRYGRNLVAAYRELLADPGFGGRVERAIVFGHPTLSREVPALSLRPGVETIVVTAAAAQLNSRNGAAQGETETRPDVYNPGHRVSTFATEVSVAVDDAGSTDADPDWLRTWVLTGRSIHESDDVDTAPPHPDDARSPDIAVRRAHRQAELAALRAPVSRRMLARAVWQVTWPHDRLVLGASRLIREVDRTVPGKKISVHSNRGLAGIDGTIATAVGIALTSQRGGDTASAAAAAVGVTRVLLGDLTLLHDVGSLLFGTGEARPRIQLIVGNDEGGTIFDTLEVAATADASAFDRVMLTPHSVDLEALAAAYGWRFSRADTSSDLDRELTTPVTGPSMLEVRLAR